VPRSRKSCSFKGIIVRPWVDRVYPRLGMRPTPASALKHGTRWQRRGNLPGNPSSVSCRGPPRPESWSRRRGSRVADAIRCRSHENVIFTSGGTEANAPGPDNRGCGGLPVSQSKGWWFPAIEHASVLAGGRFPDRGDWLAVGVTSSGLAGSGSSARGHSTVSLRPLVSVMLAQQRKPGAVQPVEGSGPRSCIPPGGLFACSDAIQALGKNSIQYQCDEGPIW